MSVKKALNQKANEVEASNALWHKIRVEIYEKEQVQMKDKKLRLSPKKMVLLTTLCLGGASVSVVGAGKVRLWEAGTDKQFTTLPTQEEAEKAVGFTPKIIPSLPGGFEYLDGGSGKVTVSDRLAVTEVSENKTILAVADTLRANYVRQSDGQHLMLSAEEIDENWLDTETKEKIATYKAVDIYYTQTLNKFVPTDYVLTEEDEKQIADGTLYLAYGADEVCLKIYQHMSWYQDGIYYAVGAFDAELSTDELVDIATYTIDWEQ